MLFFSDTLFLHWKTPRHEASRLISRWLSGSRDRHAGLEGPPRKKRRQQEATAGPSAADVSERPSGGDTQHAPVSASSPRDEAREGGYETGDDRGEVDVYEEPHSVAAGMRIMAKL